MNNQEINMAIAEACGWKPRHHAVGYYRDVHTPFIESLPDYCNDLNAMHEAEKVLTQEQEDKYVTTLCLEVQLEPRLHHATAAQRAEAFLRTIKKREE